MKEIQCLLMAIFFLLGVADAIAQNVPLDVYLCIDASGSIVKEGKLEARQEVIKLISGFEQPGYFKDEDRVSILHFSDSAVCTRKLENITDKNSFLGKCMATTNITDFEDPKIKIDPQRTYFANLFDRIRRQQEADFKGGDTGEFRRCVIIIVTDGEYEDGMSEINRSLPSLPPSTDEIALISQKPDCKEAVIFVMAHVSKDECDPEDVQNKWEEALANYPYIYLPLYDHRRQKGEEIRTLFEKLRDDRKIQFIFKDSRIYCFYYHNIPLILHYNSSLDEINITAKISQDFSFIETRKNELPFPAYKGDSKNRDTSLLYEGGVPKPGPLKPTLTLSCKDRNPDEINKIITPCEILLTIEHVEVDKTPPQQLFLNDYNPTKYDKSWKFCLNVETNQKIPQYWFYSYNFTHLYWNHPGFEETGKIPPEGKNFEFSPSEKQRKDYRLLKAGLSVSDCLGEDVTIYYSPSTSFLRIFKGWYKLKEGEFIFLVLAWWNQLFKVIFYIAIFALFSYSFYVWFGLRNNGVNSQQPEGQNAFMAWLQRNIVTNTLILGCFILIFGYLRYHNNELWFHHYFLFPRDADIIIGLSVVVFCLAWLFFTALVRRDVQLLPFMTIISVFVGSLTKLFPVGQASAIIIYLMLLLIWLVFFFVTLLRRETALPNSTASPP